MAFYEYSEEKATSSVKGPHDRKARGKAVNWTRK
jgi:hypothetical protein